MNKWMTPAVEPAGNYIAVFRCCFESAAETLFFKYSADCRAQLYLDGKRISDGPERGAAEYWYYQQVSVDLALGKHVLTARVFCLEPDIKKRLCAYAQMSVRHGLFIEDDSGLLKKWQVQIEEGCIFSIPFPDWGTFPRVRVTESHNHTILQGEGGVWQDVAFFDDVRELHAPDLPLMRYDEIFPEQKTPELFYFKEYVCAWQEIRFSGQGRVEIRWAETPYHSPEVDPLSFKGDKRNRDGKFIVAEPDIFDVDGEYFWFDFWWHAGHYVEIKVSGDVRYDIRFFRTGYPYQEFSPRNLLEKMAFETLQNCSFETYMDCPYYEQIMYVGDSRLEALCTYLLTDDHRLPAKALKMLSLSQRPDGSLNAQYPSCSHQTIPSFMLIWLLMLSDYQHIHGDDELVRQLRPRAIKLLGYFEKELSNGLLDISGWNFIDWCSEWKSGVPSGSGPNSPMNFLYLMVLQYLDRMELLPGLKEKAAALGDKIKETFYDSKRQLYALDPDKKFFSEHSQALALLTLGDTSVIPGLRNQELTPCSIYFSYYYLEACSLFGLDDLFEKRLDKWRALSGEGLTTFPEEFSNPRSDCHAWSSHILRFFFGRKKS
ncbi:MAG: hypothetical protein E7044_11900 [Lentisphaerae bacterium]|nr:hypothetical protein [Lentisphaerota bacterium]